MEIFDLSQLEKDNFELDSCESLTDEQICERIDSISSENLANMIVGYKYLGLYKNIAIMAMQELAKRRANGDSFNFEGYIDSSLKELPSIDLKMPSFDGFLGSGDLSEITSILKNKGK